jgi:hypothetical protein
MHLKAQLPKQTLGAKLNANKPVASQAVCERAPLKAQPRFGHNTAFKVTQTLQKNAMVSRTFIELVGDFWPVLIARNGYERLEKISDRLFWLAKSLGISQALDGLLKQPVETHLRQKHQLIPKVGSTLKQAPGLLAIPFEALDQAKLPQQVQHWVQEEQQGLKVASERLNAWGLQSAKQLTPALAQDVLKAKTAALGSVLGFFGLGTLAFFWGRNALMAKLQGNSGFSGIQHYASEAYLAKQEAEYKAHKHKKFVTNVILAGVQTLALPLTLYGLLSQAKPGAWLRRLKQGIPAFNMAEGLFLSKAGLFYADTLGWTIPRLLSCRDKNEFRETVVKELSFDFFFFLADDFFHGLAAQAATLWKRGTLEAPIVKPGGLLGLPKGLPYQQVLASVGGNTEALAAKLAKRTYWVGLLATTTGFSITMPLINYWYTHKKVKEEEAELETAAKTSTQPTVEINEASFTPISVRSASFQAGLQRS